MQGVTIKLDSNKTKYEINLTSKLTVITGNSASGKSTFSNNIFRRERYGYTLELVGENELQNFDVTVVEENEKDILEGSKKDPNGRIFIFDDSNYILSNDFSKFFSEDTKNIYIIIDRFTDSKVNKLKQVPISVSKIYDMEVIEGIHKLKPHYNFVDSSIRSIDYVITEDSSIGYRFLLHYNSNVISSKGKNNILTFLNDNITLLRGKSILLFVDFGSYGSEIQSLVYFARRNGINILVPNDYVCFEYLLLHSNFLRDKSLPTLADLIKYKSEEAYYEDRIRKLTEGKEYYISHKAKILRGCYFKDCCHRDTGCDKYMEGNKLKGMFLNTIWEEDFKAIQNSALLSLT